MAGLSSDFLEVREDARHGGRHRSSSGGYFDFFENQKEFERQKREMALERRERRYYDFQRPHVLPPKSAETLHVPPPDGATGRRVRSNEEMGRKKEASSREYNVRVQQPQYSLSSDAPLPSQLPVKSTKPRRGPKIQVEVTQPDPPTSTADGHTPRRSPLKSASPNSPGAQPELLYQFNTIQNKLSEVQRKCEPYEDLEAANSRDLTFAMIAEEVKGYAFQLKIWGNIVHIENLAKIDRRKRAVVEHVSDTLDRISDRAAELNKACLLAKPRDLKIAPSPAIEDDEDEFDFGYGDEEDTGENNAEDEPESLGSRIQSYLLSIQMNMQALGRLTRSLQEASPDCMDEVIVVEKLVGEVTKFFGSDEAVSRYSIDARFAGRKGLEEARYSAGGKA